MVTCGCCQGKLHRVKYLFSRRFLRITCVEYSEILQNYKIQKLIDQRNVHNDRNVCMIVLQSWLLWVLYINHNPNGRAWGRYYIWKSDKYQSNNPLDRCRYLCEYSVGNNEKTEQIKRLKFNARPQIIFIILIFKWNDEKQFQRAKLRHGGWKVA